MKLSRLQGRKVSAALRAKGRLWKGRTFQAFWMPGAPRHPGVDPARAALYAGTFASAKLDKSAVRRNRMRRRCREALRVAAADLAGIGPVQLLLCPRSSSLSCAFPDIQADAGALLSILAACPKPPPGSPRSSSSR